MNLAPFSTNQLRAPDTDSSEASKTSIRNTGSDASSFTRLFKSVREEGRVLRHPVQTSAAESELKKGADMDPAGSAKVRPSCETSGSSSEEAEAGASPDTSGSSRLFNVQESGEQASGFPDGESAEAGLNTGRSSELQTSPDERNPFEHPRNSIESKARVSGEATEFSESADVPVLSRSEFASDSGWSPTSPPAGDPLGEQTVAAAISVSKAHAKPQGSVSDTSVLRQRESEQSSASAGLRGLSRAAAVSGQELPRSEVMAKQPSVLETGDARASRGVAIEMGKSEGLPGGPAVPADTDRAKPVAPRRFPTDSPVRPSGASPDSAAVSEPRGSSGSAMKAGAEESFSAARGRNRERIDRSSSRAESTQNGAKVAKGAEAATRVGPPENRQEARTAEIRTETMRPQPAVPVAATVVDPMRSAMVSEESIDQAKTLQMVPGRTADALETPVMDSGAGKEKKEGGEQRKRGGVNFEAIGGDRSAAAPGSGAVAKLPATHLQLGQTMQRVINAIESLQQGTHQSRVSLSVELKHGESIQISLRLIKQQVKIVFSNESEAMRIALKENWDQFQKQISQKGLHADLPGFASEDTEEGSKNNSKQSGEQDEDLEVSDSRNPALARTLSRQTGRGSDFAATDAPTPDRSEKSSNRGLRAYA